MASPKKNVAYEFDVALIDTADTGAFKAAPTIAAGDFKVSTDNGALTNLATLPVVSPAGSIIVKVNLSAAEMNGDKIMIQAIDAAGNEWDDVLIFIDATTVNVDDIVRSTTPANKLDVNATGEAGADVKLIDGLAPPAANLAKSAGEMVQFTVDTATFTPTVTQFEADDITEATAEHLRDRSIIWTSGALKRQATEITAYALVGGKGKFTVAAMTEAPANNDTGIIV